MPIYPRTSSFLFISISYNHKTNLFFWRGHNGDNSASNTPTEPFFRPRKHLVNVFFLDCTQNENRKWMASSFILVHFVFLACTTTNSHKKHAERGTFFNQIWSPGSINLCVVSSCGSSQMNARLWLIVSSPTGKVYFNLPKITLNIGEECRLIRSDGTAAGILDSDNAYINAAFLLGCTTFTEEDKNRC